ncbi:eCIS core domain-containing protein [Aquimarina agarivorans]|uniref:eCIS core domain-containing protein n=1 Tax=Aquimarina agarivorans TaxID=980584 RepID=UPI000248F2C3|nr:DUF4157 domain-containing protein [Aquimarina agarivorans]
MKVAEVQNKSTTVANQLQAKRQPFFNKEGKDSFFSKSAESSEAFFNSTRVQSKLTIGKPNDKYEKEADATADKVIQRLSEVNTTLISRFGGNGAVQSKCNHCEQEDKIQKKEEQDDLSTIDAEVPQKPIFESNGESPEVHTKFETTPVVQKVAMAEATDKEIQEKEEEVSEETPQLQKKEKEKSPEEEPPIRLKEEEQTLPEVQAKSEESTTSSNLESQLNSSKGGGSSLPSATQESMGSAMGADFSGVRVHTDSNAVQMNQDLGAQAFTHGSDIYFNEGKYNTNTTAGNHLLAHELTHTVQQGAAIQTKPQRYQHTQPKVQGVFGRLWNAAKSVGRTAWNGVKKVGNTVVKTVSKGVDWILGKISPILKRIPGYTLLTVILGKDIITGDAVLRDGPNLIKGFIGLIPGGHDLWAKLEKSNMITKAFGWLDGQIAQLGLSWASIKTAFKTAVSSLSIGDVFSPIEAFNTKIKPIFASIFANILTLAKKVVKKVAEFILEGFLRLAGPMGAKVMEILRKAGDTFWTIVGNPIVFIHNLVKAVGGGIRRFATNIRKHLIGGLTSWLTGVMGDLPIQMPQAFDVKGVLHLGLQVLGVTWQNIRHKLVKRVGEPLVKAAETGVTIVQKLVNEGPMGLWEMIKEKAAEIKQSIMEGIRNWVITRVVQQGIIKLLSFLNPAGILLEAAKAIYNAVTFFVNNWQRISDFVNSVFSSIGKIAIGNITAASAFIEKAMAGGIPIILNFISRMIGLGGIGKAIQNVLQKIRKPIDKIVRKVIDFVEKRVRSLYRKGKMKVKEGVTSFFQWWKHKKHFMAKDGSSHKLYFKGDGENAKLMVASFNGDTVENTITTKKQEFKDLKGQQRIEFDNAIKTVLTKIPDIEKDQAGLRKNKGILKRTKRPVKQKEYLDKIKKGAAILKNRINKLVDPLYIIMTGHESKPYPNVKYPRFSNSGIVKLNSSVEFLSKKKNKKALKLVHIREICMVGILLQRISFN